MSYSEKLKDCFTPNTYDTNFKSPTHKSGVYFIVLPKSNEENRKNIEILYVGSASNLAVRYGGHEVLRLLNTVYGYVQFYFMECSNYREVEKRLIKEIQPKFNIQWR